jgi:hypothetical protein
MQGAAPVAPAPVVDAAPIAEAPPAPAPTQEAAPEAAPVAPEVRPHTETSTLLGDLSFEDKKAAAEAPPVEVNPEAPPEAKPEGQPEQVVEPPVEAPIVYDLKIPTDIQAPSEAIEKAQEVFRALKLSPEGAQTAMDAYFNEFRRLETQKLQDQHDAFAKTRESWRNQILSDQELGGSGHETAKQAVARMRDLLVPAADRPAFNEFLAATGAGDHPALWRMLYRAARFFDEGASPQPNIAPPPNLGKRPGRAGLSSLYRGMNGAQQ